VIALCQRAAGSCGACCGLYNAHDLSRAALRAELRRRTARVATAPRTLEGFGKAAAELAPGLPAPSFFKRVAIDRKARAHRVARMRTHTLSPFGN